MGRDDVGSASGFDFWASSSVKLSGDAFCAPAAETKSSVDDTFGGLVSFTCGMLPAIEVSVTPTFRGGGDAVSNEYGWYAELV